MSFLSQTDRLFFDRANWDRSAVEKLVTETLRGADDGELYLESTQSENLLWDDGKLKNAAYAATQGFGLRAVADETVGFAHAVTLDEATLRRAAETVAAAKQGYAGTLALPPRGTNRLLYDDANPLLGKSFAEKIKLVQEIDAYIRAKDPRIRQVTTSLSASWKAVQIIGPDGWRTADIRPLVHLGISVVTQQGERMEIGSHAAGGRCSYERSFDPAHWQALADKAFQTSLIKLEAVDVQAGEMTVVLGPGWPAVLLHEAIGHGLEGDFIRKKTSVFTELLGLQIAAPDVTIVDDGTIEGRRGSLTIDDEGTPSQCTTLIEKGKLVGFMQDRLNARLMGTSSTGNGRRESFSCQPYPRMTNTMMLGGSFAPEEIIASVPKGLYAANFGGGQVDITSGKFVFSATEAYEIENGKIGRPVKGASLVGTGFEALKQISMVGNDCALDSGIGSCGKEGQTIPVGVGQPTLKLDRVTVGGSTMG